MNTIDGKVNKIFSELSITKPPIDLERIAQHYNVRITYQEFEDDASGFLYLRNGKAIIAINSDHPINRQRFTIAHELGHYFLHAQDKKDDLFVDQSLYHRNDQSSQGVIKQEIEANRFAAALLMPKNLIEKIIAQENLDLSDDLDLYLLAKKFQVSEKAMGYRLGNLALCF